MKPTLKRSHKIEPSSQAALANLTQRREMYQESKPCSEHSLHWGWGLSTWAITAFRRTDCLCSNSISTWLSGCGEIPEVLSASVSTCRQWSRLTVSISYSTWTTLSQAYPRPVIQDCEGFCSQPPSCHGGQQLCPSQIADYESESFSDAL